MLNVFQVLANNLDKCGKYKSAEFIDSILVMGSEINPPYSSEEALVIADAIGLDFDKVSFTIDDFKQGLKIEMEHGSSDPETDVIGENRLSLGRIAWAHLKEDPRYYQKLSKIES